MENGMDGRPIHVHAVSVSSIRFRLYPGAKFLSGILFATDGRYVVLMVERRIGAQRFR